MKISIDKSVLVSALDTVSKAAPSGKTTLQILEGVLLETQGNQLSLTRNNLDMAIRYTVDCEVLDPGANVVNAKLFTDIIRHMPNEEIDISSVDNKMSIDAGQAHMGIPALPVDNYPKMPEVKAKTSFEIDQQIFRNMVDKVAFSISNDDANRPTLTAICINIKDGIMDVVGIDGYKIAWRKMNTSLGDLRILPKGRDLENISRLLDKGSVMISANENLVELVTENMRVTLRAINGEYMNYKTVIPTQCETTARIKVKEFQQALERSLLFREVSDGKIKGAMVINATQKGIKLTLAGESGTFDEEFLAEVDGDNLKRGFDPLKLYECIKRIEDKDVLLKFGVPINDIPGPCIMAPVEGDKYVYMVLAVRV